MLLFKSRFLEILLNFSYFEIVEASIYVIIYKGVWDLYDNIYEESEYSQIIVLISNYFIYIVLNLLQKKIMKKYLQYHYSKTLCYRILRSILLNVVSIIAFGSLLGIWSVIWRFYENQVLEREHKLYFLLATHFGSAFVLIVLKTSNSLYGFGGNSNDCETIENNPDESDRFFKIKYVNHFYFNRN